MKYRKQHESDYSRPIQKLRIFKLKFVDSKVTKSSVWIMLKQSINSTFISDFKSVKKLCWAIF